MLPLSVLEKVVDGVADCAKNFVNGQNNVKLEQAKMQHDAVIGGLVLGGLAFGRFHCKQLVGQVRRGQCRREQRRRAFSCKETCPVAQM